MTLPQTFPMCIFLFSVSLVPPSHLPASVSAPSKDVVKESVTRCWRCVQVCLRISAADYCTDTFFLPLLFGSQPQFCAFNSFILQCMSDTNNSSGQDTLTHTFCFLEDVLCLFWILFLYSIPPVNGCSSLFTPAHLQFTKSNRCLPQNPSLHPSARLCFL